MMEPLSEGSRRMTTLRKLPIIAPKRSANKRVRVNCSIVWSVRVICLQESGQAVQELGK